MPVKLSQRDFCTLLSQSGLIPGDRLSKLREEFLAQHPREEPDNCLALAEYLVRQDVLTVWQARKLVQGKHKGFFIGKYKLLTLLGRGGMSSVYLAEHIVMRRRCAIKILPFKQVKNAAALSRFYREAQTVAALDDPNIVRAYDVDKLVHKDSEIHFLVMEYVDGRSLQQIVDDDGPLPIAEAVDYIRQAASGLAHAHAVGVVHRDVKPSNLLLEESGTIKLLDLGLARVMEDASGQSSLTIEFQQTVLGTADYLSPEQAVDSHGVDHRTDIYSLGCTLYFLLTGHPPFPEGTLSQRLLAHQNRPPAPVTDSRPEVPETLAAVIHRMMAKQADARYQSAKELLSALDEWREKHAVALPKRRQKSRSSESQVRASSSPPRETSHQAASPVSGGLAAVDPLKPRATSATKRRSSGPPQKSSFVGEDSDEDLMSFLRELDSRVDHDTVAPSFPTSETVVSDAGEGRSSSGSEEIPATWEKPVGSTSGSVLSDVIESRESSVASTGTRRSRRRVRAAIPVWVLPAILGGVLVGGAVIGGFLVMEKGREPELAPQPLVHNGTGLVPTTPAVSRREAVPGEDVHVGPEGHFASIGEALQFVRETFRPLSATDQITLRVKGGRIYEERISIDNSQSRSFPQGVRILCEDAEPAILQPPGEEPVIDLRTVERFQLKGFTLRGSGQPTLVRLEGYLVRTILEQLTLEGAAETAIQGVGATGFAGESRLILDNITVRDPHASSVAMRFESGPAATKNLLLRNCRVLNGFHTGIVFSGDVSGVEVSRCIFDSAKTSIRFDAPSEGWENIVISNCTFRGFDNAIRLTGQPRAEEGTIRVTKNLFAEASGPEMQVSGGTTDGTASSVAASFNWTQRPAPAEPQPGEIDLFDQHGKRGAGFAFVSLDPDQPANYLRPEGPELEHTSNKIPHEPKQIGAVAP